MVSYPNEEFFKEAKKSFCQDFCTPSNRNGEQKILLIFLVYFIPAVRIFLDRQMSDIKGIYAVTFLAVSVEVCYVLLPILKQFIGYKIRIEVMGFIGWDIVFF